MTHLWRIDPEQPEPLIAAAKRVAIDDVGAWAVNDHRLSGLPVLDVQLEQSAQPLVKATASHPTSCSMRDGLRPIFCLPFSS
jgi:hypothetical protein